MPLNVRRGEWAEDGSPSLSRWPRGENFTIQKKSAGGFPIATASTSDAGGRIFGKMLYEPRWLARLYLDAGRAE